MTGHEQIVAAIIARLQAEFGAGVRVADEVDFDRLQPREQAAIEVAMVRSTVTGRYAGRGSPRDWLTVLRISCGARQETAASSVADRPSMLLLARADGALMTDPMLGGLLQRELQLEGIERDTARGEQRIGVSHGTYTCEHQTSATLLAAI